MLWHAPQISFKVTAKKADSANGAAGAGYWSELLRLLSVTWPHLAAYVLYAAALVYFVLHVTVTKRWALAELGTSGSRLVNMSTATCNLALSSHCDALT